MKALKTNIKAPVRVRKYSNGGSAPTDPPSEFEKFLAYTIKKKGGTADQYNDLMTAIAFHETGPHQRMKSNAVQLVEVDGKIMPGGPGRGLFMFEEGDDKGGITAINRTYKEYTDAGMDIPEFLSEAYKKTSIDMSQLTEEQQKIVFLGNYLQHPKANFSDVMNGKQTYDDFWFSYHQAGGPEVKEARLSAFQESQKARKKNK